MMTEKTLPDLPVCFPNITSFVNTSSTKLLVKWTHLTHHCGNGGLKKYHLGIIDNDKYPDWIANKSMISLPDVPLVDTTKEDWIEFSNLRNYWKYSVFILYENVIGKGPISNLLATFTEEDGEYFIVQQKLLF